MSAAAGPEYGRLSAAELAKKRKTAEYWNLKGPHVRDKTSLRAQCARIGRDTLIYYLVCLVVLVHTAYYFTFEADVIPIRSCDDPLWAGADCSILAQKNRLVSTAQ